MDLPNLLNKLKNSTEEARKFIAIEIAEDVVKTAIWQSSGQHTEVVSLGSIQPVEVTKDEDVIRAIDASLADAQSIVEEEPDQVIFGLPDTWVDDKGIRDLKKHTLKTICQKLDLKAIGFVESIEAIIHHLRDTEGGPPSAILIRLSHTEVITHLVYLGKVTTTQRVLRSGQIAIDVEESIARIPHTAHLPSRLILLVDTEDQEDIKQELLAYDWQKRLQFLHYPKIESLPREWSIKAVAVAGGAEVVASLGISNLTKEESKETEAPPPPPKRDFGFSTVIIEEPTQFVDEEPSDEDKNDSINNDFINEEATITERAASMELESVEANEVAPEHQNIEAVSEPVAPKSASFTRKLRSWFDSVKPKTSGNHKSSSPGIKKFILPVAMLLLFGGLASGSYLAYATYPQATIDLAVSMHRYQQQIEFTVDPQTATSSLETSTIAGKQQTIEQTGQKTIPTSGTKTVGERAKGKVVLYNRTTAAKTFKPGDTIKVNDLRYAFDTSVTIASASTKENADFSVTTEPSKVEAPVTAVDIGEQYNVAKDTQFTVANFAQDNFIAVAINTFSGGSARKVAAVTKDDVAKVKKELLDELTQTVSQSVDQSGQGSMKQLPVGEPEIKSEEYSAAAGEEASNLTLDITLSQTIYVYDINELTLFAHQTAQSTLPENAQIKPDSTQVSILESVIESDNKARVKAQVILQYLPSLTLDQYKKALTNTSLNIVDTKLRAVPNFQSSSLTTSKWLLFGRLPPKPEQITIRVIPVAR